MKFQDIFYKYSPRRLFNSLTNLKRLLAEIFSIRQDITQIQTEISSIQQESLQIQTEISSIQQESLQIQTEISSLRQSAFHIQMDMSSLEKQAPQIESRFSGLIQQIIEVNTASKNIADQMQALRGSFLATRFHNSRIPEGTIPTTARPQNRGTFAEQLNQLKDIAPNAFSIWHPLLEVNSQAYVGTPLDSCSVAGHAVATLFHFFLAPYLKGRVLDIGCGPQPVPFYLEGYPLDAIYGIDPLSEPNNHPFNFIKGFAEFLPWEDHQFNLVVAATSLDHVLFLDKTFEEIKRVLTSDGYFAVWDGFIPGSKPYDPYSPEIQAADQFHLFHFDRQSFLDSINPFFYVFEEYSIDTQSVFFILRPK